MEKKMNNKKVKAEVYFDENTQVHIVDGNTKVGKGIYCINLLSGDEPLRKKNGQLLINISGTCGGCCDVCKNDCYAIRQQIFRSTEENLISWGENTILAKEYIDLFFKQIQDKINRSLMAYIRFHAFGEIPSYEYLEKMVKLAEDNPKITFYTYSKRYEWIENIMKEKTLPENLIINISIWHKNYNNPYNLPEFIYDDQTEEYLKDIFHCPAVDKEGHDTGVTCASCKRCFTVKKGYKTAVYAH